MAGQLSALDMPGWMRWVERQLRTLDAFRQDVNQVPVGGVILWPPGGAPAGWLNANGGTFSDVDYPELQDVLGSTTLPNPTNVSGFGWIIRAE